MTAADPRGDKQQGWLSGDVALITGATTGIGRAVLARYIAEGAKVTVLGRRAEALRELSDEYGDAILTVLGDVADPEAHQRAVADTIGRWGRLDMLVGNAGIFDFWKPMARYDLETLDRAFDELIQTNVKGYMFAAYAAREALSASNGSMIFTSSVAGFHAGCGGILYTMAKHAIVGLIRQLALELAPQIRVNGVAPGATTAPLSGTVAAGQDNRTILEHEAVANDMAKKLPLGFVQQPEDHAAIYVLLGSRQNSRAMTGQIIVSDSGQEVRAVG